MHKAIREMEHSWGKQDTGELSLSNDKGSKTEYNAHMTRDCQTKTGN